MIGSTENIVPRISLVGAGPGDPELITLKGLKALQSADVVLYDALIDETLLDYAPKSALKIFVGKRAGKHALLQQDINQLMVDSAQQFGHVVRLKGGDPFVFGRGYEELLYAGQYQIPIQYIPGISSSTSLGPLQGIPLTHRSCSQGFMIMTATQANGKLSDDLAKAVRCNATLIVLMGYKKLAEITALYIEAGKASTPLAIIENGSTPKEKVILTRADEAMRQLEHEQITGPVLLIFGEVVALHPKFQLTNQSNAVLI